MDTKDIYWVAGLLEGEGSFGYNPASFQLRIQTAMTDLDVLERAQRVTGLGSVNGPYNYGKGHDRWKDQWSWTVARSDDAYALMVMVWPLMGERRRRQITAAIKAWLDHIRFCRNGHARSEHAHRNRDGHWYCRECGRQKAARHRAKMREEGL